LVRYGQAEPWKVVASKIGRTKPSRSEVYSDKKRKKNDGRPPDTNAELLQPGVAPNQKKKSISNVIDVSSSVTTQPFFIWKSDSCWLDVSLQLLYTSLMDLDNFDELSTLCQNVPSTSGVGEIYGFFKRLHDAKAKGPLTAAVMTDERNQFRKMLQANKIIKTLKNSDSIWVRIQNKFPQLALTKFRDGCATFFQKNGIREPIIVPIHTLLGFTSTFACAPAMIKIDNTSKSAKPPFLNMIYNFSHKTIADVKDLFQHF
jgi:hypothetical protein